MLHPVRHVDEHAEDAEELSLMRLLDDETALHGPEERVVRRLRHGIEEPRQEQLDPQSLGGGAAARLPCRTGKASPRHQGERCIRRPFQFEQIGPLLQRVELAHALFAHPHVGLAARRRRSSLVVLDPGGEIVPARHAGVADRADAGIRVAEPGVVVEVRCAWA